jgi:divalent metal cation (Fe/Co/Zn/Cd) transporter
VKELVDYSDEEAEGAISKIVNEAYPEALGIHRIRSRKSGRRSALDIELLSCRQLRFKEVHGISHKVQRKIVEALPHVDVIIHSEPCHSLQCPTDNDCLLNRARNPKPS